MTVQAEMTDLMKPEQLAALWQVKPKTLDNWRSNRTGPPYLKINGSVRYSRAACAEWLAAQQDEARTA